MQQPRFRSAQRSKIASAEITRRVDLTDDLWQIWLKPDIPFTFKPGQYCTIGVDGLERAYSIVSSPRQSELELFIELVPPPWGNLTPILHKLQPGATVSIRPRAKGVFVFKPEVPNHLLVATVTGVVPYVSILRHYLEEPHGDFNFFVLEGASYKDEFGYDAELRAMAAEHDNITFVPTVSRPTEDRNAGWEGETGRVNTVVEKYLERFSLPPSDTVVYACGHPEMIEDVKARLAGTRYRFEEERFWKQ